MRLVTEAWWGEKALKKLTARDQRSLVFVLVSSLSLWLVSDGGFWGLFGFSAATNATRAGGISTVSGCF